ncbi:hypothetical protein [Pseudonocardia endophytica]|uniref:Uncharacterized protein n=1 Tax=Pseudonocardia endophytica TaxID=401976 RepID=A0A4R1HXJ7_PSEEN|nr:hypothetical protein [Pseudonocardia endophytica]TCK22272.1 hypothetical protein EV378_6273 [Pseudonocardia endophytica]
MRTAHGPYAEWVSWLDAFARGEDLPSRHLTVVDEQLGPHMVGRLLDRLAAAFRARADRWTDTLRRHLDVGPLGTPTELAAILVAARGRLRPLTALAADPRLPEEVRTALSTALRDLTGQAQDSLEQAVRRRPGADRLIATVRENRLTAVPPPAPPMASPGAPPPPVGRRVIL